MLDNLNKLDFTKKELDFIKSNLDIDTLINLCSNYELVNDNILLLKNNGINNIEDIFITFTEFFLNDKEKNIKKFTKFNIKALVSLINEDFTAFSEINNV